MRTLGIMLLGWLALAGPALAEDPAECLVAIHQAEPNFRLPLVARAIAAKHLDVLVVGAGSSVLPGPDGVKTSYPARLQQALAEKLPGVAVTVATDVKSRRTAGDMVKSLAPFLAQTKPALMIWQTGTVDAMLAIDSDEFSAALEKGVTMAHAAGADVVLINAQYSPRTESMIALGTYLDDLRWVAVQQEVPLFDRFSIMKLWSDLGTFDLTSATNKLDIAMRVHNCLGILLADLMIEATKPEEPPSIAGGR
jgi:hypothetical protein